MSLKEYHQKRDFSRTAEPRGEEHPERGGEQRLYVIQKHDATRLHYDFRLEHDGVLWSWAVPKGPSLDPRERRLAVRTEDHPLEYGIFEGIIPEDEYGGGTVMLWDRGHWEPIDDPDTGIRKGKLKFHLYGQRLRGIWNLVRTRGEKEWLLIKSRDDEARDHDVLLETETVSVATGREMEQIAREEDAVWHGQTVDPSQLDRARKAPFPRDLKPQLATLAKAVPQGDEWLHELKHDGYRMLAHIEQGKVRLLTRTHQDWTERFPEVVHSLLAIPLNQAILDGEVVVVDERGISDFQSLQSWFQSREGQLLYYAFDMPYCEGYDLTQVPLIERKELLAQALQHQKNAVRYSDHIVGHGDPFWEQACKAGVEGIVSKRCSSSYQQQRTTTWLKVKCVESQEFVVGGFTEPTGKRQGLGALLVGSYDEDRNLVFAGKVGTGFTDRMLDQLIEKLEPLEVDDPPFSNPPREKKVHWVKPRLVAHVQYTEMTREGILRHPSFQGLREDKPARQVRSERPDQVAGITISNPDRVVYPDAGFTKLEVARYYEAIGDLIMPHTIQRPLALVRCPTGMNGQCFFHKHYDPAYGKHVSWVNVNESDGPDDHFCVDDLKGIVSLIQFGTLELHPWGCRADRVDLPDRMIFDLDPGPGLEWKDVVEAALEVRDRLSELGLESFCKTTGGKGLHVVVPLQRRANWEQLKAFSHALATAMAADSPKKYTDNMAKSKRHGRIFLDYLRNQEGATAVGPYSTRARPGGYVSAPVNWDEVTPGLDPTRFTIKTVPERKDPWEGFFEVKQRIKGF